jgi:hypothetical protein
VVGLQLAAASAPTRWGAWLPPVTFAPWLPDGHDRGCGELMDAPLRRSGAAWAGVRHGLPAVGPAGRHGITPFLHAAADQRGLIMPRGGVDIRYPCRGLLKQELRARAGMLRRACVTGWRFGRRWQIPRPIRRLVGSVLLPVLEPPPVLTRRVQVRAAVPRCTHRGPHHAQRSSRLVGYVRVAVMGNHRRSLPWGAGPTDAARSGAN